MCARRRNSTPRGLRRRNRTRSHARNSVQAAQNNVNGFFRAQTLPRVRSQRDELSVNSSTRRTKLNEGSPTPPRAPPTSTSPKRVAEVALQLVVDADVISIVPFRVLACECRSPRFSVIGEHGSDGHDNLAGFLYSALERVGVDPLYCYGIGVGRASNGVVLAIVFCGVLDVSRISRGVDSVRIEFDVFGIRDDLYGNSLRRWPRAVLRLGSVHLPGSRMLIGCRGGNVQSECHEQQSCCENGRLIDLHNPFSLGDVGDGPVSDVMDGNSQKVQKNFADSTGVV